MRRALYVLPVLAGLLACQHMVSIAQAQDSLAEFGAQVPRLFLLEIEYDVAMLRAEAGWMRGLIGELRDGTLPGIEQWRQTHETGQPPADMVELAENSLKPRDAM